MRIVCEFCWNGDQSRVPQDQRLVEKLLEQKQQYVSRCWPQSVCLVCRSAEQATDQYSSFLSFILVVVRTGIGVRYSTTMPQSLHF